MPLLPVIERELRSGARNAFTYHLRVLGGLSLLLVFALFALGGPLSSAMGGEMFRFFHGAMFLAIWMLVPLLTADCISRERREGTLPLLFLTPLKARDILFAKGTAQALRAFMLWLAAVPMLTICLLVGGVAAEEIAASVLINFSSIFLALGMGLLASGFARSFVRALALAYGLNAAAMILFFNWVYWTVELATGGLRQQSWMETSLSRGFALALNADGSWQNWLSMRGGIVSLMSTFGVVALTSLLGVFLLFRFCAWGLQRSWKQLPPSPRMLRLRERLFRPLLFQTLLRRWLDRQLRSNPIGWLEQRSWSGRLVTWSWIAVVTCIYASLFVDLQLYRRSFHGLQLVVASFLAGAIALTAAGSFRRERESGLLELLLVSPLHESHIIMGRIRGIWMQFLPAVALLFGVWIYCESFLHSERVAYEITSMLFFTVTFATLPVVGLYFSLACRNFLGALIWTLILQAALPLGVGQLAYLLLEPILGQVSTNEMAVVAILAPTGWQVLTALVAGLLLRDRLRGRRFAFAASPAC